jgi:hypothetical protein
MKAQVYFQKQHRNEGKLALARFPYNTSTIALSKTTLHHEVNLTHANFPSTVKKI